MTALQQDFPLLKSGIVYLDSAATTQKPQQVIDAMTQYYTQHHANIHRGLYQLSQEATVLYEKARQEIASFINAQTQEIIFTSGTTASINMLAHSLPLLCKDRKEIIISAMEHHANLIPWQQAAQRHGMTLHVLPLTNKLELDYKRAAELITSKTAIVACVHVSNTIGTTNDVQRLCALARKQGAYSVIDGAQAIAHLTINVQTLDCDFYAFSGHKMYGPTGIGVLYGRQELLATLPPAYFGGDMVETVTYKQATWASSPQRFEAGTPPLAQAQGLAEAARYIRKHRENILVNEQQVAQYARKQLQQLPRITLLGKQKHSCILSFVMKGIHPHDVASLLDEQGIAIRAGHHCTMPLITTLGIPGTCRISIGCYTTIKDIDALVAGLRRVQEAFS
ncbi:SufS family cysteine desulfurase [Candidatus Woesearchaeota archaeon]|nr:SufS family cysteine desulfurase [Candidatus Woesearchaeota archaeon]